MNLMNITKDIFDQAFARVSASKQFWAEHATKGKLPEDKAKDDPATNDDRTIVEVYSFQELGAGVPFVEKKKPYAAYFKQVPDSYAYVVTFTGEVLAIVVAPIKEYTSRGAVVSTRKTFRALGIDGRVYACTHYCSSGDIVRMTAVKQKMKLSGAEKLQLQTLHQLSIRCVRREIQMRVLNRQAGLPIHSTSMNGHTFSVAS